MPLVTKVGLCVGHIVLHEDQLLPSQKGAQQPPIFGPCLLWPNGRPSQLLLSTRKSSLKLQTQHGERNGCPRHELTMSECELIWNVCFVDLVAFFRTYYNRSVARNVTQNYVATTGT